MPLCQPCCNRMVDGHSSPSVVHRELDADDAFSNAWTQQTAYLSGLVLRQRKAATMTKAVATAAQTTAIAAAPVDKNAQDATTSTKPSCLRTTSAYQLYVRLETAHPSAHVAECLEHARPSLEEKPKKKLSFADDHGLELALERNFYPFDAPVFCNDRSWLALTGDHQTRGVISSLAQRLMYGTWRSQDVVSVCALSCSVLGCLVFGFRHMAK